MDLVSQITKYIQSLPGWKGTPRESLAYLQAICARSNVSVNGVNFKQVIEDYFWQNFRNMIFSHDLSYYYANKKEAVNHIANYARWAKSGNGDTVLAFRKLAPKDASHYINFTLKPAYHNTLREERDYVEGKIVQVGGHALPTFVPVDISLLISRVCAKLEMQIMLNREAKKQNDNYHNNNDYLL